MKRAFTLGKFAVLVGLLGLVALPASGVEKSREPGTAPRVLSHLSQAVQLRYFLQHPEQAPPRLQPRLKAMQQLARSAHPTTPGPFGDRFNFDDIGFPQNEEAVTVCENQPQYVLGGTNDYRGIVDPQGNFTGWHFSTNGGDKLTKEGLLPPVPNRAGKQLPSGGDPVVQSDERCNLYATSLNYNFADPNVPSGIGLYKTDAQTLQRCPFGDDFNLTQPACWPKRKLIAQASAPGFTRGRFLDKEWFDVGRSGRAGKVIWVAYADFAIGGPLGFTGAQVKAVRCQADLTNCTRPILISGGDPDIQFADVTISETGRTLITWVDIEGELEQTAQTFTIKARIAPAGSTNFGPTRIVNRETNPLPFGGFLHSNDFRIATYPKSIMPIVNGKERPFVIWDRCRFRLFDQICEEPEIRLSYGSAQGTNWSRPRTISTGGDNYFPAVSDEGTANPNFAVSYYTNRFDKIFHNRQDVELVMINKQTGGVVSRKRVTAPANEPEADPLLGGVFIGDYFDVHLLRGIAYVHYNANKHNMRIFGVGFPIPQQDNFLTKVRAG